MYAEKGILLHCWWEYKLVQPLWRTVCRFLKKLKIEVPYDSAIPLLGIYLDKTIIQNDTSPLWNPIPRAQMQHAVPRLSSKPHSNHCQ